METSLHPQFHSSRVASAFVEDLYVGLPPLVGGGRVGISPVKLTNHFPEANPPTTLTLDRRLTVFAADRRSSSQTAVLHHIAEVGTSFRPKRESSPGLVSWLLRRHLYGDTSYLPPFTEFEKQVLSRYGPAQVDFDRHFGDLDVYGRVPFFTLRLSS